MKKLWSTALLAGLLTTWLALPAAAAVHSDVPLDVETYAAQEGLPLAKKLLALAPADIGLSNAEEVNQLTLGPGLQLHTISPAKLESSDATSLLEMTEPQQEWEFVVEKDGKPVTFLLIASKNGHLEFKRVGGKSEGFWDTWNQFEHYSEAQVEPTLVVSNQVQYLVGTIDEQEVAFSDLANSAIKSVSIMAQPFTPASDIAKTLKKEFENNRNSQKQAEPQFGAAVGAVSTEAPTATEGHPLLLTAGGVGLLGMLGLGVFAIRRMRSDKR